MKTNRRKIILLLCIAAAFLIPAVRAVALPFVLALFLAGCLQQPIEACRRRHIPRAVTALAILILFLAPLAALLAYGCYSLLRSARSMMELLLPLLHSGGSFGDWLYRFLTALPPDLQQMMEHVFDTLSAQKEQLLAELVTKAGQWSTSWIAALPGHLAKTGLFLLFFLFCAIGYPEVKALLRSLLPKDWLRWLGSVQRETKQRLGKWCAAEIRLVSLIFGVLALGLCMLRVDSWIWMALVIALVDLVPLVGAGLILIPWAIARFVQGFQIQGVGLLLLWACVWLIRTLLEPKLVGHQLQLPSAISFFAAILGVKVWGLKGLILFPVLAAVAVGLLLGDKKGAAQESGALRYWDSIRRR